MDVGQAVLGQGGAQLFFFLGQSWAQMRCNEAVATKMILNYFFFHGIRALALSLCWQQIERQVSLCWMRARNRR